MLLRATQHQQGLTCQDTRKGVGSQVCTFQVLAQHNVNASRQATLHAAGTNIAHSMWGSCGLRAGGLEVRMALLL